MRLYEVIYQVLEDVQSALLGMLNSCASNVTVVNIDNGFGAGFVASLINRRWEEQSADGSSCRQ